MSEVKTVRLADGAPLRCLSCLAAMPHHYRLCPHYKLPQQATAPVTKGPTRATTLPEEPAARKTYPIASGVLDYFPDAIVAISNLSYKGNEQHNPGKPLHWDRSKSTDHADTAMRHFMQRGTLDTDGVRHTAKAAWRILAALQTEIEQEQKEAA